VRHSCRRVAGWAAITKHLGRLGSTGNGRNGAWAVVAVERNDGRQWVEPCSSMVVARMAAINHSTGFRSSRPD
jgi:hypothetical protein